MLAYVMVYVTKVALWYFRSWGWQMGGGFGGQSGGEGSVERWCRWVGGWCGGLVV